MRCALAREKRFVQSQSSLNLRCANPCAKEGAKWRKKNRMLVLSSSHAFMQCRCQGIESLRMRKD